MSPGDEAIHRYRMAAHDAEREDAANVLKGVIEQEARRVARHVMARWGASSQFGQDLIADSVSKMWPELDKFDDRQPPFERWCHRVLRNFAVDGLRRKECVAFETLKTKPDREFDPEDPAWAQQRDRIERRLDATAPFSQADLKVLELAPPKRRVIVLAFTGLYSKVEPDRWEAWCREAHAQLPFPPDALLNEDEVATRVEVLAAAMGVSPSAIRQHWHRGHSILESLHYGKP